MRDNNFLQFNNDNVMKETNKKRDNFQNSCAQTVKIPSKWGNLLLLVAFFCFVNRFAVNFVAGQPLDRVVRQAMPLIPKFTPTTESIFLSQKSIGNENFSLSLPGGVLTAHGAYTIGIIGVVGVLLYVTELVTRLACCVVRRLNNPNGDRHEFEMANKLVFKMSLKFKIFIFYTEFIKVLLMSLIIFYFSRQNIGNPRQHQNPLLADFPLPPIVEFQNLRL